MLFPPPFPHESHIAPSKTFLATFHPSAFIPSNAGSWNDKSSWLDGSSNYYTPTWQTRSCHAKFSELLEKEFWKEDTPGVVRTLMMYVCWCCFALEQFTLEVECEIWTRDRRLVEASWERGGGRGARIEACSPSRRIWRDSNYVKYRHRAWTRFNSVTTDTELLPSLSVRIA